MIRLSWKRGWRRVAGILPATLVLLLATAPLAFAEGASGQAPAPLGWIDLQDTRGISVWNHELSLDRGTGFPFNPEKFFWSSVTDFSWNYYRGYCAIVLWFLDWVLKLEWIGLVAGPLMEIGDALQRVVANIGLVPTFLTVTAVIGGLWMLKGRMATGLWDVLIACAIAALGVGVFAHPVQMVAGPEGYVVQANRLGQEVAAALATGQSAGKTPEQLRRDQTGQMVDVFIRQPLQMINYGRVLDGGPCEATYNEVTKAGPYGSASTIRDEVAACDQGLGDYAAAPTASMASSAITFQPAGFIILIFAVVLAGSVIAAGVWAMFQSVKAIWSLVAGLLPGGMRGSALQVAAEVITSLVIIVFTQVFLAVFLLIISALFQASTNVGQTFLIADILLILAILVFLRQRARLKQMADRLAQWMAWRPGTPTQLPGRVPTPNPIGSVVRTAANVGQLGAQLAANRRPPVTTGPTYVDNRQQAVFLGSSGIPTQGTAGGGYAYQTHPPQQQPVVVPGEVVGSNGPRPGLPASAGGTQLPPGEQGPELPGGPTRPALPPGPAAEGKAPGGGSPSGCGPVPPVGPPQPSPRLSRAQKAKQVSGLLVRAGTNVAMGYLTGGAATVARAASKAGGAVNAARRTALVARLKSVAPKPTPAPATPPSAPRRRPAGPGPTATPAPVPVVTGRIIDAPSSTSTPPAATPRTLGGSADQLRQRLADRSRRRPPPASRTSGHR